MDTIDARVILPAVDDDGPQDSALVSAHLGDVRDGGEEDGCQEDCVWAQESAGGHGGQGCQTAAETVEE